MAAERICDVVVTREQLDYLGRYASTPVSPCSPFFNVAPPEALPAPALEDLVRRGLLGTAGVEPNLLWTLELLKGAVAYGALALQGDAPQGGVACFLSPPYSAALVGAGPGLRLVSPLPGPELAALLREAFGTGPAREASFDVDLPPAESLVLAAALDLLRRDALRSLLDGQGEAVREDALVAWLARSDHSAQWLLPHLGAMLDRRGIAFELAGVRGTLEGLLGRGLLARGQADDLLPSAAVAALVRPLALLDHVVQLRAGRAVDGSRAEGAEILVVRALSSLHLLWEVTAQGAIHWTTPSPGAMSDLAARLLSRADALAGTASE